MVRFDLSLLTVLVAASSAVASVDVADSPLSPVQNVQKRTPVPLYQGEDPQLAMVKRSRLDRIPAGSLRRRHHDFLDLSEQMPSDLAKRQSSSISPGTGTAYPAAGGTSPPASSLPQAWVDKYNAVKKAGLIPDIPPSVADPNGLVDYPAGTDMSKVCSWTLQKCFNGDIYQAPDNSVALGIDDGPTPDGTGPYLDILKTENITATHFLIGSTIVWNPDSLTLLAGATPKQNLGVHTWSHTLQTTKTDLEIVGELGWTAQIIYDMTGYIPNQMRCPEGDVDNRVRAIAKYVFGMQSVMWTVDADDWCLRQGNGTATSLQTCVQNAPNLKTVQANEVAWASPKTKNTGFITLNHETTDQSAMAFGAMVRAAKKENWDIEGAVPNLQGLPWYNNAYGPNDTPTKQDNILPLKDFVNVTNPTAAKGSKNAPSLGNWGPQAATQNPSVGQQAATSSGSGSGSKSGSSSSTTNGSTSNGQFSTSGALRSVAVTMSLSVVLLATLLLA